MLCDRQIRELNLIDPFVEGVNEKGKISYGSQPFGYDLRLGNRFLSQAVYMGWGNQTRELDPRKDLSDEFFEECLEDYAWKHSEGYVLEPGQFILGETVECVNLPPTISGELQTKSTYCRLGISLFTTIINPGFSGKLTLEIVNLGYRPVLLVCGQGIAEIQFYRLEEIPDKCYKDKGGKYQDQKGVEIPKS